MADDRHREATAKGARLGILGEIGWFVRPDRTRSAMDGVSPGTARGTVNVLLWFVAFAGIVVGGRAVASGLGLGWIAIALVVMIPIGWNWPFGVDRDTERLVGHPPEES